MSLFVLCIIADIVVAKKRRTRTFFFLAGIFLFHFFEREISFRRCPIALHFNCMPKKISDNPTRVWQAAKDKDGNLLSCSQVSEDFFYCERHETRNMLQGPVQELNLFKDSLWKKWRTSLAMKFRCLESSASFLPARPRTLTEDLSVALAALNVDKDVPETTKSSWRVVIKKRTRSDRYASDGDVIAPMNDVLRKREEKSHFLSTTAF